MIEEILKETKTKMQKALDVVKEDFATIRAGRANSAMFNKVLVDYYGTPTPIAQLASFKIVDPRMIVVSPFDKSALNEIDKAIRESDLSVNPIIDSDFLKVPIPELNEERRKEMIKVAKHKAEEGKVSIRNIRRHAKDMLEKTKKNKDAGEDEVKRSEKKLESLTHSFVERVDEVYKQKEEELLKV